MDNSRAYLLSYLSPSQREIRRSFNADELIQQCRDAARTKIENATRPDGTLNWAILPSLVTVNPKLEKTDANDKYMTAGFQLAPSWASGYNTCAGATIGCSNLCLFGAGHGQRHMIHDGAHHVWIARITRTILFYEHRDAFKHRAIREIQSFRRKASRAGVKTAFRPNVLSDIDWQALAPWLFEQGLDRVYDYTKVAKRVKSAGTEYHLTVSRTETMSEADIHEIIQRANVAVVFNTRKGEPLPSHYLGYPVFDGDVNDNRFKDPIGHIIGLREKRTGKADTMGFVVHV
jgi:hypothetical protein